MNRISTSSALLLIIFFLQAIYAFADGKKTDHCDNLVIALPEEAGMSSQGLGKALKLYKDAVLNKDLLGAVLLVSRNGKVVLYEAVGLASAEKKVPLRKDAVFRMYSLTKPVIAAAILMLAEEGKINLDDPINKYIPNFRQEPARKITVRQLLNHTSGLRIPTPYVLPLAGYNSQEHLTRTNLQFEVARLADVRTNLAPGTSYTYSNAGYNVLGAIIEIASGLRLEEFLVNKIHAPLGATNSHYDFDKIDQAKNQVPAVSSKQDGQWNDINEGIENFPIILPAGALFSTALDYAKFCKLFLDNGVYGRKRLMQEGSIKQATASVGKPLEYPYPAPEELESFFDVTMLPWYYRRSIGEYRSLKKPAALGLDVSYGYGWVLGKDGIFSHGGLYGTFAWVDPKRRIIGIILTQNIGAANPGVEFMEAVNASLN